jgi:nucleoid-associated protein YgaU
MQTPTGSPSKPEPKPARPDQRIAGAAGGNGYTTYTVQKGDILEEVARKTLGSSKRWPEIVEANKAQISDPESIQVGMTLRIPAR